VGGGEGRTSIRRKVPLGMALGVSNPHRNRKEDVGDKEREKRKRSGLQRYPKSSHTPKEKKKRINTGKKNSTSGCRWGNKVQSRLRVQGREKGGKKGK